MINQKNIHFPMTMEDSCVFLMFFQEYIMSIVWTIDMDSPDNFNWRKFRVSTLQKYAIQKMQSKIKLK